MNYYVYLKICIWNDWRAKTGAKHLLIFCFECFFILLLTFLKNHFKGSCTRSGCRSINGIRFSNMKRNDLKHYSTLSTHFLVLLLIWNLIWLLPFRKRTTGSRCTPRAEGQHKRKWRRYTFEWCEQNDVKKKSYCAIIRRRSMLLLVSKSYPVIILNVCWTMLNDHDHNHTQSCVVLRGKKKNTVKKITFMSFAPMGWPAHQQYSLAVQQLPFAFDSGRRTEVKKSQFCLNCLTKRLTVRLTNVYPIPHGALQHTICRAEMVDMFCRRVSIMHQHRSSLINLIVTQKKNHISSFAWHFGFAFVPERMACRLLVVSRLIGSFSV